MAGYRLRKGFGYRAAVVYLVLLALGGAGCRRVPTAARVTPVRPPAPDTRPVVCIDPGHPTENNSGRTVQNGTTELAVNWEVAGALQSLLAEDGRIRVVKTRARRDQFMRTRERARVANACRADLALHLHCDTGAGSGYTVYYPDRRGAPRGEPAPPRRSSAPAGRQRWRYTKAWRASCVAHFRTRASGANRARTWGGGSACCPPRCSARCRRSPWRWSF